MFFKIEIVSNSINLNKNSTDSSKIESHTQIKNNELVFICLKNKKLYIVDKRNFFIEMKDNAISSITHKNVLNCLSFYCLALVIYRYVNNVHEIKFIFVS